MARKRLFKVKPAPPGRSQARKIQILLLLAQQYTNEEIIAQVKCTKGEIDNVIKQYKAKGDFEDLPRSGRPEVFSAAAKRAIVRHVTKNPTDTLGDLQRAFKGGGSAGQTPAKTTFTAAVLSSKSGSGQSW